FSDARADPAPVSLLMKRSGEWWEIAFIPSSDANRLATPETLWQKVPLFAPGGFLCPRQDGNAVVAQG
ncbi:MAG TPA: hypothetical protein VKP60_07990, partial [Magnetospirillaceae bacterium]|nr:hypothetical protein [Magnetospirillaceae bacterium]